MRIGLYIIFILITAACHEVKVGYLETEGALYDPDTMEIKIITDKTETGPHWISPPIQGVEGYPTHLLYDRGGKNGGRG